MTGQIVKRSDALATVEDQLTRVARKKIEAALAGQLDSGAFLGAALAVVKQSDRLAQCSPPSILSAVYQCAVFRMIPDPVLGQCYIVPRRNKAGRWLANFQLGYKGAIALMYRSRQVVAVRSNVVREGEHVVWRDGLNPILDHEPAGNLDASVIATWAVIETAGGGKIPKLLSRAQIDRVKARSDAGSRGVGPWANPDDFAAMAEKTAILRAGKTAPVELEIQRAIALDEMAEANVAQPIDVDFQRVGADEPDSAADAFEEIEAEGAEEDDARKPLERKPLDDLLARLDLAGGISEVNAIGQEAKAAGLSGGDMKTIKAAVQEATRRLK